MRAPCSAKNTGDERALNPSRRRPRAHPRASASWVPTQSQAGEPSAIARFAPWHSRQMRRRGHQSAHATASNGPKTNQPASSRPRRLAKAKASITGGARSMAFSVCKVGATAAAPTLADGSTPGVGPEATDLGPNHPPLTDHHPERSLMGERHHRLRGCSSLHAPGQRVERRALVPEAPAECSTAHRLPMRHIGRPDHQRRRQRLSVPASEKLVGRGVPGGAIRKRTSLQRSSNSMIPWVISSFVRGSRLR